jgi:hypothetical protein
MVSMDIKNQSILQANQKTKRILPTLSNGDTVKQLLARSRYLLYKSRAKCNQKKEPGCYLSYPDIKNSSRFIPAITQYLRYK